MGEMIQIQDTKAKAFLAESGKRSAPGILIMHAWWGLNAFIKGLAYRLAKAGYTALAIDYYSGGIATTIEEAKLLRSRMDRKASNKMIQRATRQFLELPAVAGSSIGVIGFSVGCGFALEIARRFPDDTAAICSTEPAAGSSIG
jgi:carboxymethylenebutenolidase